MSDAGAFIDPVLVDDLLQRHMASPGVLDDEVLDKMHALGVAVSFLPMQCVFMAKVFEQAHREAIDRRRQLRRQELQENGRFMGRLSVTLFGIEGLQLPPPQDGWQHASIICQLRMNHLMQPTTRCSASTLYWDQEFEFEVSRPCSNFICKVVRVLVPQQPAHPAKGSSTRSLHAAGSHASLAPDTPAGRGTARQRVPSAASGRESEITVPLAEAQVPLATLEACKARKRWLSLQSICAQTTGSSGADQNAAAANPEAANAPSTSKAHVAGADAAGVEGGTETATAYGDAEQQAVVAGERESSARMQMKMQYQYSETYMAHSMPDVAIDFRICILGAGGAVGRKVLECFLKAELWPASRIVACTRSLHKVQAEAAAGVVCTNQVSAAMQGCRVLVICCRADQLVNQVAREVRDNLAPDALVLSVVVGLARKRQAQLLGIEETRLFRIAAPETESVEATYHEFVRAAAHQRADAGVADGAGGGGEQAGDGAGGVGKRQETAAGLELDEGHRAESGAVLSAEDKTNGVSAPPPPAPVSTADSAVPAAENCDPVSSDTLDQGAAVARNGVATEGLELGAGERRSDNIRGSDGSQEGVDGRSNGDAHIGDPGGERIVAGGVKAPDGALGGSGKVGDEEGGERRRGADTMEEGRGSQPAVGQRRVERALTYEAIIQEEERVKREQEEEEARILVMREAALQTTMHIAGCDMVSDVLAMRELVENVSTALQSIGRPRSRGGATGEPPKPDARGLERTHALAAAINALTATASFPLTYSSEGFLDEQAMREQLPHHIDQPWDHVLQNEARLELLRAHFFKVVQPLCGDVVSSIMAKFAATPHLQS